MMKRSEVIVVGAGPAGIVAAIAAQKRGLQTIVLDARIPPIDKPCGEGILPQGVAALRALGISFPAASTLALRGIQFVGGEISVPSVFPAQSCSPIPPRNLLPFPSTHTPTAAAP